jgi:undecaprenyl-diphosphatase
MTNPDPAGPPASAAAPDSGAASTAPAPGTPFGLVIAGVAVFAIVVVLALGSSSGPLTPIKAIVLGAVEGLTEFLPVSSTGHLLVTQRLLDLDNGTAADAYVVAIQLGAILAVVALYRHRLAQIVRGVFGRDDDGRRLAGRLLVAFAPAAVVGVVLGDTVKDHLFGPWPIVAAWVVGGVFLLWWHPAPGATAITALTLRSAAIIGGVQLLAFWPGTSRSLVTIVAALAVGLTMAAAVEFSFLLGLLTLGAATAFDLLKDGQELLDDYGWRTPLLGALVGFVTALIAVRWLVSYLRTRPLTIFGWYRLGIAAVTVVLIAGGAI